MSKINSFLLFFVIFPICTGQSYLKIYDNKKIALNIDKYDDLIAKNEPQTNIRLTFMDTMIVTDALGIQQEVIDSVLKSKVHYIQHINKKKIIDLINYKFKITDKKIIQIEMFLIYADKRKYFEVNSSQLKYNNRLIDYLKSIDEKYYIYILGFEYQKSEELLGFVSTPILYIIHPKNRH